MTTVAPEVQAMRENVLAYLLAHPEEHNQEQWAEKVGCNTTMCIAGTTCHVAGDKMDFREDYFGELRAEDVRAIGSSSATAISTRAQRLLGLDEDDANSLFLDLDTASALSRFKHLCDTGTLPPERKKNISNTGVSLPASRLDRSHIGRKIEILFGESIMVGELKGLNTRAGWDGKLVLGIDLNIGPMNVIFNLRGVEGTVLLIDEPPTVNK